MALNRILGEWKDWRLRAACRDTGPDLFFPVGLTGPAAVEDADAAKAVCRNCPVCAECLEFAMVSNQQAGVWGGATEEERRTLRRSDRITVGNAAFRARRDRLSRAGPASD